MIAGINILEVPIFKPCSIPYSKMKWNIQRAVCRAGTVYVLPCLFRLLVEEKEPSRFKYFAVCFCYLLTGEPKEVWSWRGRATSCHTAPNLRDSDLSSARIRKNSSHCVSDISRPGYNKELWVCDSSLLPRVLWLSSPSFLLKHKGRALSGQRLDRLQLLCWESPPLR